MTQVFVGVPEEPFNYGDELVVTHLPTPIFVPSRKAHLLVTANATSVTGDPTSPLVDDTRGFSRRTAFPLTSYNWQGGGGDAVLELQTAGGIVISTLRFTVLP